MRSFMVGFLIFILASCLTLLIFKPMFIKDNKNEDSVEKSRVEELLSGEKNNTSEENHAKEITSDFKPFEDEIDFEHHDFIPPERPNHDEYANKQNNSSYPENLNLPDHLKAEDIDKLTSKNQNMIDEKTYKEFENKINDNPKLKAVTNELKEKYKNNPNAEVSNEDINYFMLKMLESSQSNQ